MRKLLAAMFVLALAPAAFAEDAPTGSTPTAADPAPAATAPVATATATPTTSPTVAPAVTAPAATLTANAAAVQRPDGFHIGVSLDHSVGSGTFATTNNQGNLSTVVGSVVLAPNYAFEVKNVKFLANANGAFSYEYTQPDYPNVTGRHYDWGDIGVGLSAPAIYKEKITGISFSPRIGVTLPVSLASIFRGTITNLTGGVSLGRGFGKFSVGANIGASKTFYSSVTRNITQDETKLRDPQGNLIFTCRTDSDNCGLRGIPTLWSISGGLGASYSPIERLSIAAGLNLSKGVAYWVGRDELTSKAKDSNGNPVAKEQATRDMMLGSISVGYQLTDNISASLAMATAQPPLSLDNKRLRFPFFGTESVEDSPTSYSLSLSAEF